MDKDSFEQVYIQYHKVIYAYLLSLCRSEELAADLAQETFYKALRGIDRFQGECALNVWLCSIAKHALMDYYRRHRREARRRSRCPIPRMPTRCREKSWNSGRRRWCCTRRCTPCRNPTGRCSGCGCTGN